MTTCPQRTPEVHELGEFPMTCYPCHVHTDGEWDGDDDGEPTPRAFCDGYTVHDPHAYRAVNGNTYDCPGFDADDMAELVRKENEPPCEHGLSADLCAGPMHYPPDIVIPEPWDSLRRVTFHDTSEASGFSRYLWQALRIRNTGELVCIECGTTLRKNARNLSPWLVTRIQHDHSRKEHRI